MSQRGNARAPKPNRHPNIQGTRTCDLQQQRLHAKARSRQRGAASCHATANDYKVLVSDNACAGAILFASQKFTAASAYLQLMTEESADVYTEYFDQGLKLKNNASNDPRQVEVLNLIRNAVDMPLAFLFDNLASRNITTGSGANPLQPNSASTIYDIIEHALTNNTNAFSSIWDSEVEAKNRELQSVVDVFNSK